MRTQPEPRDWSVSPFEPLNIRSADFDPVPVLDGPILVNADPTPVAAPAPAPGPTPPSFATPDPVSPTAATAGEATVAGTASAAGSIAEHSDRLAAAAAPDAAESQKIVTVRVCAAGEMRWSGTQLMAAFELHGLAFGRYQVFHRRHADGRSLFCVASLIEPGTFDIAKMPAQEFRGVTLFAVLPGPLAPLEAMDELVGTARGLAEELSGMVQDAKGMPLSPQRAAALREDVARFQASLARN